MHSDAATVPDYLDALDDDRRAQIKPIYTAVRAAMPDGYEEGVAWGMITWSVPLTRFPDTYNGQPLAYVSLASQKRHNALYLMGLYGDDEREQSFRDRWTEDGRKLDMGKSCLRFRRPEDLRLDLIAEMVSAMPPATLIARHEEAHARRWSDATRPGRTVTDRRTRREPRPPAG